MKVLIVTARRPQLDGKGDQQRTLQLARVLAGEHDVRVVTVRAGRTARTIGAAGALLRGRPAELGWMLPPRAARRVTAAAAQADVVIAVTIRCLPDRLPAPTVLDHVDALSVNLRERARLERRSAQRAAAIVEARLLRRHERRAARWVVAQTVVSARDAAALPQDPRPFVLPLVVDLTPEPPGDAGGREIDVIMTGDMRYPPNRDGAIWLATEIAPALRAAAGEVRIVIAGRAAASIPASPGIELRSDVPDIGALLRRAKVAAVPLRLGTGTPIKLLEAAAAGAAPVATPWVAAALELDIDTAADAAGFAAAIARLLADPDLRRERAATARTGLESHSRAAVSRRLHTLLDQVDQLRSGK